MLPALIAVLMSITAAALEYYSWCRGKRVWAASSGWLLALASILSWSRALGPEIGICYAIMIFVCLVWVEVAWNMEPARAAAGSRARTFQPLYRPGVREYGTHALRFLLSVPAAGILALMFTSALALLAPWTMPLKVAVVVFLFPVAWGAFSVWICAQENLLKPVLASVLLLLVSSLLLFA